MPLTDSHRRYWSTNLRLTAVLTTLWFVVSFVLVYFSRELSFTFFGWPFSVWVAGQGSLIVYGAIIWFYARTMNRLDDELGVREDG